MKRWVYILIGFFTLKSHAQSIPVRNVNNEYVVAEINGYDISNNNLNKIVRDKTGMYWFQGLSTIYSFDGVNWKPYMLRSANGKFSTFRINDIIITSDNLIWLATENGIYLFDRGTDNFIPVKQKFPGVNEFPLAVTSFLLPYPELLLFTSEHKEGFFLFEWSKRKLEQVIIDGNSKAQTPAGEVIAITADKKGNLWGLTKERDGIWHYNISTHSMRCSWKKELEQFSGSRFQNLANLVYTEKENALWISHGRKGYVEKIFLGKKKSLFYSFSEKLRVQADSLSPRKYPVHLVKLDKEGTGWIKVGEDYLVKLADDINQLKYLAYDPNNFPIRELQWAAPESSSEFENIRDNRIQLWVSTRSDLSIIRKRSDIVRQIPFDTSSATGLKSEDYDNADFRKNIFFEKGRSNEYYLIQQNEGRPKLISIDESLKIKKVLFDKEWKEYPAYFCPVFNTDTFFIAFMRKGIEPLDFRNVIIKEFKVDLHTFRAEEIKLDFKDRIRRYGCPDANNIHWLFSNGSLFSYDTRSDLLDSIFVCEPGSKDSYRTELIKGYDYPTVLHKETGTFWIDFISNKELYKINLRSRKIERIFKCCINSSDCDIAGGVYDMYSFDEKRIYLQQSFSAKLLEPASDSVIDYLQVFNTRLLAQTPSGSGRHGDWISFVLPSTIYLLHTITGRLNKLTFGADFTWKTSQFNSKPLVNDKGEMILMSSANKGFLVFDLQKLMAPQTPGLVNLSFVKIDNRHISVDSLMKRNVLKLKYNKYNSVELGFSDFSIYDPDIIKYEYTLYKGGDTVWTRINGTPELTLTELSAGKYHLLLRAVNDYGDYSPEIITLPIIVRPPFLQTASFQLLVFGFVVAIIYSIYRYRMQQVIRLQTIRNNIASDLHDDIGSTLNSISIYSEVAKQQAGKNIPALDLIGSNSRKIIEGMSDIVWTINPENDSFEKIIARMRSFAHQILKAKQVEYSFEVDDRLNSLTLPMQVRKNFYLVFKEAITNLVKYSGATRVLITMTGQNRTIHLGIRDNGIGIPDNPTTQGNGLMNMKRRAREINADIKINSGKGEGTGIELILKT